MDRRSFMKLAGGTAVLSLGLTSVGIDTARAADATSFADLGLTELKVTLTDAGYQVSPATIPAGWTLVTFENRQGAGDNSADLMALPPGLTAEDFIKSISAPSDSAAPAGPPPAEIYQATFVGVPWAPAGTSAQGVMQLTAGDWVVFNGGTPSLGPTTLKVATGGGKSTAPDLEADVEVTFQEFAFLGLDKPDALGQKIWKITNTGKQPHLMTLNQVPAGTTREQLMATMMMMMSGTPAAGALAPDSLRNVGGCATISHGQTIYLSLDLKSGTYGAICFFPDQQSGAPHAMMGMVQVFTLS